jgi:alpha-L-fucosidase
MPLQPQPTTGDTAWFTQARFGMFIHWGLYALPARHEWIRNYERISNEDYQKYFDHFNPDLYDPREWAKTARAAGMKYVVLTSKHHEGFCLWDTQQTDYKVTNTPYGKDLLKPFVDAFRAEGLRIGFYYSLIDWHHPDFPIDCLHPLRDYPSDEIAKLNQGRDVTRYAAYMREQVRELLTQFGQIDILWTDFSYPGREYKGLGGKGRDDWQSLELLKTIREVAPKIILNNRMDLPDVPADIYTPEQYQPAEWFKVNGQPVVWETCQTFSGSWGYHRDESTWKSPEQLIQMLINSVACGGNLLMNVGPTGRGNFDKRADAALQVYGDWLHLNGRSIYGCTQSDFTPPQDARYTQNGNRLYIHLFSYPFKHLRLPGLAGKIDYVQFLHDASEILYKEPGANMQYDEEGLSTGTVLLHLPVKKPDVIVPVIEVFLKD